VNALLQLACSPSTEAQAHAIRALRTLVEGSSDNQIALLRAGGIGILVSIAGSSGTPDDVRANITWTMGVIVKNQKAHGQALIEAGGLPMLVHALQDATSELCRCAVFTLRHLALCSVEYQLAVARTGAIPPLVRVLEEGSAEAKGFAAGALATLADSCSENQVRVVAAGGIAPLAALLEIGELDARRRAASAIANVATHSEETRSLIGRAGCIGALARLAGDSAMDGHGQSEATFALMCLAFRCPENQAAILQAGGLAILLQVLREGCLPTMRGYAAGALGAIAECNPDARVAIAQAGGVVALANLAREGGTPKACKYAIGALRLFMHVGATGQPVSAV